MTQKRFTRKFYSIWDNVKNKEFYILHYRYEVDDMCNILNNYEEKVKSLEKENKQLKRQIDNLKYIKDFWVEQCECLEKENEQLKSEIKEVLEAYKQLWMSL